MARGRRFGYRSPVSCQSDRYSAFPPASRRRVITRFAPSTTGQAHPGTLLSALLVWLDARSRRGTALLRLEDIDRARANGAWSAHMIEALSWLGLDWDDTIVQSNSQARHEAALDQLARKGVLYPCVCSRADRRGGRRAPDGAWAYDNTCRGADLPSGGWRAVDGALRVRLPDQRVELFDDSGLDLSQHPAQQIGDPIVRRRDGEISYQLAVVVDDADRGITDVIRGRDIAPSTATQVLLQRLLDLPTPRYRHHFLLLEPRGDKLAKLHGSIPFEILRARYDSRELCGLLAASANLGDGRACSPIDLVAGFDWSRVAERDRVARWAGDLKIA